MICHLLTNRAELKVSGLMNGAGAGALMTLMVAATVISKAPMEIIATKVFDTVEQNSRLLESQHSLGQHQECSSTTTAYLREYAGGERMTEGRHSLPLGMRFAALADPPALIQTSVLAQPIRHDLSLDHWYVQNNDPDYCHALAPLLGPTA